MLIDAGAVKLGHTPGVSREMGRYPVQNHSDSLAVHIIHEIHEIIRGSETAGGCIIPRDLIAPRGIQRMLHHRHQLHMGIPHLCHVFGQLFRYLTVVIKFRTGNNMSRIVSLCLFSHPGAEVYFIDRHGGGLCIGLRTLVHPFPVVPLVLVQIPDNRCRIRPEFGIIGIGIGFERRISVFKLNFIFINRAFFNTGYKYLKNPGLAELSHLMPAAIPEIEITHNADTHRTRRPYCKIHA